MLEATAQGNRRTGRSGLEGLIRSEDHDRSMPASSFTDDAEPSPDGLFDHRTMSVPRASMSSRGALRRTGLGRSSRERARQVD